MALYKGATKLAGIGVSNGIITSATAPISPVEGMVWYDTTNDVLKSYDGTNWNDTGKTYTAGTGISIDSNNVISNTQTSAEWGNITGTLSNQTDLNTALSGKQDTLTLPSSPISGHLVTWGANNKTLADGGAVPTGFNPGGTATTGYVVTKTADGYEWAAPTGGLQVSPNSTITGIKYVWYGTEADYANLAQYYTVVPGDTEFHCF